MDRHPRRLIPVLFGRTREHRDAVRFADGADLDHEHACAVALTVLPLVLLAVVLAILVSG